MQFTVKSNDMDIVKQLAKISSKRALLPILGNILIRTEKDQGVVHLNATDLEIGITATIEAEVVEDGDILVSCERLAKIVNTCRSETISFKTTEKKLEITCDSSKYRMPIETTEEFPKLDQLTDVQLSLDSGTLSMMLDMVTHCVSNDQTRIYLGGVNLEFEDIKDGEEITGRKIIMVGTDGKRLAVASKKIGMGEGRFMQNIILPLRYLNVLTTTFKDPDEMLSLGLMGENDSILGVTNGSITMIGRILEGSYPDWRAVIDPVLSGNIITIGIDTAKYVDTLTQVSPMLEGKYQIIQNTFELSSPDIKAEDVVTEDEDEEIHDLYKLNAVVDYQEGEALASMHFIKLEEDGSEKANEPMTIGFNISYLAGALRHLAFPMAKLLLHDPLSPIALIPFSEQEIDRCFILMPVRL